MNNFEGRPQHFLQDWVSGKYAGKFLLALVRVEYDNEEVLSPIPSPRALQRLKEMKEKRKNKGMKPKPELNLSVPAASVTGALDALTMASVSPTKDKQSVQSPSKSRNAKLTAAKLAGQLAKERGLKSAKPTKSTTPVPITPVRRRQGPLFAHKEYPQQHLSPQHTDDFFR